MYLSSLLANGKKSLDLIWIEPDRFHNLPFPTKKETKFKHKTSMGGGGQGCNFFS